MLKILQARLQQYVNCELPDVQAGFTKSRDITLPKKVCLVKAFDYVDHNKLWKILKEMGIPDHLTCLLGNLYAGHPSQLEWKIGLAWANTRGILNSPS